MTTSRPQSRTGSRASSVITTNTADQLIATFDGSEPGTFSLELVKLRSLCIATPLDRQMAPNHDASLASALEAYEDGDLVDVSLFIEQYHAVAISHELPPRMMKVAKMLAVRLTERRDSLGGGSKSI